jgi:hypothetical protein
MTKELKEDSMKAEKEFGLRGNKLSLNLFALVVTFLFLTLSSNSRADEKPSERWAGKWVQGVYTTTIKVENWQLMATFVADFQDLTNSDSGEWMGIKVSESGKKVTGRWESDYTDAQKSGKRCGTFTMTLHTGWFGKANDKIIGEYIEECDNLYKQNHNTSMFPGKKWSFILTRKVETIPTPTTTPSSNP